MNFGLISPQGFAALAVLAAGFLIAGGANLWGRRYAIVICGVQGEAPMLRGWGVTSFAIGLAFAFSALNIGLDVFT